MSSFRIDRQYVSFQTAETQPVRATPPPQVQKQSQEQSGEHSQERPADQGMSVEDISKIYNEIYERLLAEHAEQAENMLSKASDEAREIVENAKKQAEEITDKAQADARQLQEELQASLENAAEERRLREEKELRDLESGMRSAYETLVDGMQDEVIGLVMEIVRKVIGIKLSQSDDVFLGLVRDALDRLKHVGSLVVRVSSEDYARYFGGERGPALDAGDVKVSVAEEPDFSVGDLVVESEGEMVDLSVGRQLDQIEQAFES
ncbi:Flagellar biosynthesis/type III secretory pathway protein FliH [Sporobacter termitidis DSM 10068]|uniref:Flagellar biosynthesis/type III secretory pathway protein FliH n=1 Tax=Sporobacter termitidis DSM 10068 TaxID=1123282 RepID=A0A1M5W8G8_9FIRM|nr:FliH/SctL family protein [Sporobacter termitidis]SHH83812.1 Flagellar biosynthesis/type III secretory pathway protein FliH [Sporobacter termitidis DSM 10068]